MTRQAQDGAGGPLAAYMAGVAAGHWQHDGGQAAALRELDRIHHALLATQPSGWLGRLRQALAGRPAATKGLYLWGEVGRGKTLLMDLFYERLPLAAKRRVHFHRFMGEVHARMRSLGEHADPLAAVAAELSGELRVLCLDEFFVADIGDAMILARLLEGLFAGGVVLVTTSNTPPVRLYHDGLQRARFLPAIDLLQRHCVVHRLDSPIDYRLRTLRQAPVYHAPADANASAALAQLFSELTRDSDAEDPTLEVNGRPLRAVQRSDGVAWFTFAALCEGPRAVADYIELARDFHTLLVEGVPLFDGRNDDPARRFVHLVDALYDHGVNLAVSAAAAPTALYRGERLAAEFQRTASRLIEMQSEEYMARPHRG